jgi:hypothetical protein
VDPLQHRSLKKGAVPIKTTTSGRREEEGEEGRNGGLTGLNIDVSFK